MAGLIAIGLTVALATGTLMKFILDRTSSDMEITWVELAVGGVLIAVLVVPLTAVAGTKLAISDNSRFHEYWNGWETQADEQVTTCTEDGRCVHDYDCDPYVVPETYTTTDAKGHVQVHTRMVTRFHSCPVGTQEVSYVVRTTVGDFTLSSHQFNAATKPWRAGHGLGSVPTTPPALWTAARDRIASGKPGPATSVHDYTNYVLASQRTVLTRYSSAISRYTSAGLLPDPASGVHDTYLADKAHFVGWTPTPADAASWQEAVGRVSAALGVQKQGDLQVVLVRSDKVTDPDEYTSALMASWQRPQLGRNALSKNGVVVVVGTSDGKTVSWARASTGMPVGNNGLQVAARTSLTGTAWTPAALVGTPTVKIAAGRAVNVTSNQPGAIESLLWDKVNGYQRVQMSSDGKTVGFDYLKGEITPTTGQNVAIEVVMGLLSLGLWGVFAYVDVAVPGIGNAARRLRPRRR